MSYVAAVFDDRGCGAQGPRAADLQATCCLGTFVSLPLARSACARSEHGVLRWWEGPDGSWQAAGRERVYRVFTAHGAGADGPLEQAS